MSVSSLRLLLVATVCLLAVAVAGGANDFDDDLRPSPPPPRSVQAAAAELENTLRQHRSASSTERQPDAEQRLPANQKAFVGLDEKIRVFTDGIDPCFSEDKPHHSCVSFVYCMPKTILTHENGLVWRGGANGFGECKGVEDACCVFDSYRKRHRNTSGERPLPVVSSKAATSTPKAA